MCLYIKKKETTKDKLNTFMTGSEHQRTGQLGMSDVASISLQSMENQTIHENENQDKKRKRNESASNEKMYDEVITPRHRESDSNGMYKVNEETNQKIENEKSDDVEEQLYIKENGNIVTDTTTDVNTQMTIEGDLTPESDEQGTHYI